MGLMGLKGMGYVVNGIKVFLGRGGNEISEVIEVKE